MADFIPSNNFRAFDQVQDNGSCISAQISVRHQEIAKGLRSLAHSRSLARTENIEKEVMQSGWLPTSLELRACEVAEGGGWKAEPLGLPQQGAHDWSKRSQGTIETRGRRQYTGTHA